MIEEEVEVDDEAIQFIQNLDYYEIYDVNLVVVLLTLDESGDTEEEPVTVPPWAVEKVRWDDFRRTWTVTLADVCEYCTIRIEVDHRGKKIEGFSVGGHVVDRWGLDEPEAIPHA